MMLVFVRETGVSYHFTHSEYHKIIICSLSLHIYFSQKTAGRLPTSFGAAGRLVFARVQGRKDGAESVMTENKTRVTHKRERKWGSLVCGRAEERKRSRETEQREKERAFNHQHRPVQKINK